jgi:hypothetical protein
MMKQQKKWMKLLIMTLLLLGVSNGVVVAQQSSSTNYEINEYFVGPGGELDLSSTNYNARATLGDLGVGNLNGVNYQLYAGFTTTIEPYIELVVNQTTIDMGLLDEFTTGTGTATFSVRTYLAEGYSVYASGELPTIGVGGPTIDGISTQAASSPGTEQFGFNLVANTSPVTFGANRVQYPDASFSFGEPTDNYNDNGLFKFSTSEAVASSTESSGRTDYTVSYIMNVAPLTDAGVYVTNQTFVATSTF